ncbi:MAG: methyl-accepting chemotaxis protein [Desulfovibrio sp.]|nr:methyl-accepting chemotaxis protein [Desulfovibrio sp.]
MNVKMWLITLCCFFTLGMGTLFFTNAYISKLVLNDITLPQISDTLKSKYEYGIKHTVELAAQTLGHSLSGISNPQEKYAMIEKLTDFQRFFPDGEGYLFTYKVDGTRINVPVNKSQNGQNCMDMKDSDGAYFVRDLIEAAKKGGGFVVYRFEKPGAGVQPKLGYAQLIPGTDVMIGTGVYIDGVDKERARINGLITGSLDHYGRIQLGLAAGILAIILALSWGVARLICPPLHKLTNEAGEVAAGRLTHLTDIQRSSPLEIRALHNSLGIMIDNLHSRMDEAAQKTREAADALEQAKVAQGRAEEAQNQAESARRDGMLAAAGQLEGIAEVISSASTELSAQIEQSDRGAADSSLRLAEAATAMNQMNATVQEVARNAGMASGASTETRDKALTGASIVQNVVNSIAQVQNHSLALKGDMGQLGEHAQAIGNIMNVISDIADQTNLLALNAAIEAARAGDAGRGFAVVADEVRKLAEKTMSSTHDVAQAINAIQKSTQQSMSGVESAVRTIGEATVLAGESGEALREIVTTVGSTADQVNAIAAASEEQSAASEEINRTILEVNDMSRQTASAMAEAAKAVNDLAAQAQKLTELIGEMKQA